MVGEREQNAIAPRLWCVAAVVLAFHALLLWRLWMVQVHEGEQHTRELAKQSVRRIRTIPARGRIFARDGETVLVDNVPCIDLLFHPSEMRQPGPKKATEDYIIEQALLFADLIGRPLPLTREYLQRRMRVYPALPLTAFDHLTEEELARTAEHVPLIRGTEIRATTFRSYPFPGLATHVLGFSGTQQVPDGYERRRYSYAMPEPRGRSGIELEHDEKLSGKAGTDLVLVDTLGFVHREFGLPKAAKQGLDVVLSLDLRAQMVAERILAGRKAAMVVVEVKTGAVLAMASSPTYDLASLSAEAYGELAADTENRPLMNRAIATGYLPGSIVKPLVALAMLHNDVAGPEDIVDCPGYYKLGDTKIRCWHRSGHGPVNLVSAIEQSCNTYFIEKGMATGLDRLRPMLVDAGLGERTGIDLAEPNGGLCPSRAWARDYWGRDWIAIDTSYLSIGQGAIHMSPLQAAMFTAAIANGGTLYTPYLAEALRDQAGRLCWRRTPESRRRLSCTPEHLDLIRRGMTAVVYGDNATAVLAQNPVLTLAGKTGTAEVERGDHKTKNTWFICYGPVEEPRYALAVVVEDGESGGKTAAPLAGRFFTLWLSAHDPADMAGAW